MESKADTQIVGLAEDIEQMDITTTTSPAVQPGAESGSKGTS